MQLKINPQNVMNILLEIISFFSKYHYIFMISLPSHGIPHSMSFHNPLQSFPYILKVFREKQSFEI